MITGKGSKLFAIAAVVLSLTVIASDSATALGPLYFDAANDASSNAGVVVLVAGTTRYVKNAQVNARAYFSSNTGNVRILGSDWCGAGAKRYDERDLVRSDKMVFDARVTTYRITDNGATNTRYGLRKGIATVSNDTCGTINVGSNNLKHDSQLNLWYMDVSAQASNPAPASGGVYPAGSSYGYLNGFRVQATGPNAVEVSQIGESATGSNVTFQTTEDGGSSGPFMRYLLPFGSDCTVTSATPNTRIALYDLDNSPSEPTGAQSNDVNRYVTVELYQQLPGGAYAAIPITSPGLGPATSLRLPSVDSTTQYVSFTAQPEARYQLILDGVKWNNTIQASTPFDGIYNRIPCPAPSWEITGTSTVSPAYVSVGETASWTHSLSKSGSGSAPITYTVEQSRVPIGAAASYATIGGSSTTTPAGIGVFATRNTTYTATDSDVGYQICQRIRWSPTAHDNAAVSRSTERCIRVGLRPTAHIWGNDLRTGSAFSGSGNTAAKAIGALVGTPTGYKGTWAEYGVLAPGVVASLASGSGLNRTGVTAAQSEWSKLTAASTPVYGQFAPSASLGLQPDIAAYFLQPGLKGITVDNAPGNLSLGNMLNVTKVNSRVYVRLAGTVTITNNITLNDDTNLQDNSLFPQIVIIANNINIHSNVSRLDAWLIAKADAGGAGGVINTCSNQPATLTNAICDTPLVVNGPMIAKQLLLRRTAGDSGTPAEIINLRSDAYLWANYISSLNSNWVTTSSSELPPRY